jgi:hypothetical protein
MPFATPVFIGQVPSDLYWNARHPFCGRQKPVLGCQIHYHHHHHHHFPWAFLPRRMGTQVFFIVLCWVLVYKKMIFEFSTTSF